MEYDKSYLEQLIQDEVEENLKLDYKAAAAILKTDGKKKEISKDVSAMANSAGGQIIYGIKEFDDKDKRHKPECIDAIKRCEFSKEWLEQVINGTIRPKIDGLKIFPISVDDDRVVYVVDVPQSNTVHQANDKRYYKRYNFESVAMEDYEIKDIMNRVVHPQIHLSLELVKHIFASQPYHTNPLGSHKITFNEEFTIQVSAENKGNVYAKYVNIFIRMPITLLKESDQNNYLSVFEEGRTICTINGDNRERDVVGYENNGVYPMPKFGSSWFNPLLPKTSKWMKDIPMSDNLERDEQSFTWTVYADNAAPISGEVKICEIPFRVQNNLKEEEQAIYEARKRNAE